MILSGARWFDSNKKLFHNNDEILIEDGLIKEIGQKLEKKGQNIIDLSGKLITPGWIDSHIHITLSGEKNPIERWQKDGAILTTIKGVNYLKEYIRAGVTIVRDLGGDKDIALGLKQAINEGLIEGPALYTAGRPLTMTGGHIYQIGQEVDGVALARKGARKELKKGVDLIKVIATGGILTSGVRYGSPQLTVEEMKAIVEEAHKADKSVSAHVESKEGIINCLKAGVDTIEHGIGIDHEIMKMMKAHSVILIPTLAAPRFILKHKEQLPDEMVSKAESAVKEHKKSIQIALKEGCIIAVGTDAGTPFNYHGGYYNELEELLNEGIKVEDLLQAMTLNGAKALGIDSNYGNIEKGKRATLTIIEDSLDKKDWYKRIDSVILEGNRIKI